MGKYLVEGVKMKIPFFLFITLLFGSLSFLSGCDLFENEQDFDTTGNIFGKWVLEEIQFDNGDRVKPNQNQPYWFELREDSVFAEQEYHYSLIGKSYCNPCFGYFDYNEEDQSINISFICERLVCGIASDFSLTVAISHSYSFRNGKLLLFFDSIPQHIDAGRVILKREKQQKLKTRL